MSVVLIMAVTTTATILMDLMHACVMVATSYNLMAEHA